MRIVPVLSLAVYFRRLLLFLINPESVTVPNSVTNLNSNVFYGCTGLKEAVVNGGSLYYEAFGNCTNLKSLTIGENVRSISSDAFRGCTELTSITIDSKNPKYDSREDCNAIICELY